ncbi:hypothetical protein J4526_05675 [Desulfurococcaceae archaeon MEX13E-LK6-19]|nr:hypothetical protein J4526_05675 [Desulfurococcaceae archaeon MEX13E-LK6-19]
MSSTKIIAVLATIMIIVGQGLAILDSQESSFDGAILAEIFTKVIDLIISEKYNEAKNIINDVKLAEVPYDIAYLHKTIYEKLDKIVNDLIIINKLMDKINKLWLQNYTSQELNESITELKKYTIKLYGDKLRLETDLDDYVSRLLKYVNTTQRTYYTKLLSTKTYNLLNILDERIYDIIEYINKISRVIETEYVDIKIGYIPRQLPAGSKLIIPVQIVSINESAGITNYTLMLRLWYEYWYLEEYEFSIVNTTEFNIVLRLLDAKEIIDKSIPIEQGPSHGDYYVDVYGVIYCLKNIGNESIIVGKNVFNLTITLYEPQIMFIVPQLVYYGENTTIKIFSGIECPVNVSIILDGVKITRITVRKGITSYTLPYYVLGKGYHTLVFKSDPTGKYVGLTHTAALAVVGKKIDGVIKYSRVCIQPFISYVVKGIVYDNGDLGSIKLVVSVGNDIVYNDSVPYSFSAKISLPYTFLISVYDVVFKVVPEDPRYDPLVVEAKVIVVNIASLVILSAIMLALMFIETPGDITAIYRFFIGKTQRALTMTRTSGKLGVKSIKARAIEYLVVKIRKSWAASIYWKLVGKLSRVLPKPLPHETLREYYKRSREKLPEDAREVFGKLTLLVEKDLYSIKKPDKHVIEELVKRVENALGE